MEFHEYPAHVQTMDTRPFFFLPRSKRAVHLPAREKRGRSARNEALSQMGVLLPGRWCTASIIQQRKDRPEHTTLQAWPMSDSSSFLEQALRLPHPSSRALKRSSLSGGNRSWPATVSTVIPKKERQVIGLSRLCAAVGTPNSLSKVSRFS